MKKWLALIIVLSMFLVTAPVQADPGTLYVDIDGLCDGNSPCYTHIQDAVNAAGANDTVYVYTGTYYEHVTINQSLTLQGESRETTTIDGSGTGSVVYITANYVTLCGLKLTNGDYGVDLIGNWQIHHVTMRDIIVTANQREGIHAPHSRYSPGAYHVIEDCIISHNGGWALYAHQFSRSTVQNCEIFGNSRGLDPAWGFETIVANNKAYDNDGPGIHLDSMVNTVVEKNEVWNNATGISVGYVARDNTIRDNVVHNNDYGFRTVSTPHTNRFYHNDLIDNTVQACDCYGTNAWDNGYPDGGNYWSDYTGLDDYGGINQDEPGKDGIGDTPYAFEGGQDNYPLIGPWNIVQAAIDLDPDTLNLQSKGKWISAYIELPEGYNVADIDAGTVMLEDTIPARDRPTELGDHDDDGVPALMVKFDRQALVAYLDGITGEVTLTASGNLCDGMPFEGSDTITVINPGR